MYTQKSQNPLVDQGELTLADARGHGEGGQVKAGQGGKAGRQGNSHQSDEPCQRGNICN